MVPQKSAAATLRAWTPLAEWLSRRMGAPVRLVTAADIPAFESCLARGAYDIAYMNPYHFVTFNADPGYRAVAHRRGDRLHGVLVAKRDGPIRTPEDLEGRPIAFPSPAAFGASLVQRAELRARGIAFMPRYVRSHESVYLAVARGLIPAGGGVMRTLRTMPLEVQDQLVVIHQTEGYTPHAVAVGPQVPKMVRARLRMALADAGAAPQQPLAPLGFTAFELADDAAWDDVRALGIPPQDAGLQLAWRSQCLSD
ncbi:phosphate/phosphite/phosphonate ABC transporter substrate-binding protein [Rhodovulum sp. DZ06]|uniref:phosphate/phosphite/phosphonate ABC transporter substrate-binding protein n=1 Tax=Rhodovulum sp. DZ06 TaxID=3425126 RepID=UPI003D34CFB2